MEQFFSLLDDKQILNEYKKSIIGIRTLNRDKKIFTVTLSNDTEDLRNILHDRFIRGERVNVDGTVIHIQTFLPTKPLYKITLFPVPFELSDETLQSLPNLQNWGQYNKHGWLSHKNHPDIRNGYVNIFLENPIIVNIPTEISIYHNRIQIIKPGQSFGPNCRFCQQRGHWSNQCKQQQNSLNNQANEEGTSSSATTNNSSNNKALEERQRYINQFPSLINQSNKCPPSQHGEGSSNTSNEKQKQDDVPSNLQENETQKPEDTQPTTSQQQPPIPPHTHTPTSSLPTHTPDQSTHSLYHTPRHHQVPPAAIQSPRVIYPNNQPVKNLIHKFQPENTETDTEDQSYSSNSEDFEMTNHKRPLSTTESPTDGTPPPPPPPKEKRKKTKKRKC